MKKAIINATIYDFNQFLEDAYILMDETILEVGKMSEFINDDYEVIDALNKLVMPGLVVGHTHIYSTFARGLSVPFHPKSFSELLEQLWWKLDRNLTNEDTYYSGIVSGVDFLKNGVTTLIDHHASGEIKYSLDALKKSVVDTLGMRGIFCFETSDRFSLDDAIKENMTFIHENKTNKCAGLFGMHASLSLSEKSMIKIAESIGNEPIHIHVAESIEDQEDSLKQYGMRVIERLHHHKLLHKHSILSHCIHVTEDEIKLLKDKDCYVALNVTSNMNNAVGLPDYQLFKKHNIPCLIGNDGISSSITSEWLNINFSMHLKDEKPDQFGFNDLIQMIQNNYEYVNKILGVKIGQIKPKYQADLLMIPYQKPTPMNQDNMFGHILFGMASSFKPSDVFVDGNYKVKDYKILDEYLEQYKKAIQYSAKLWKRIESEDV